MEDTVSRREHEEFVRRMDEANARQSKRISLLEGKFEQMNELTASVRELAANMDNLTKEMAAQGKRLERMERQDGEMWRTVLKYGVAAITSGMIGFLIAVVK